MYNMFQWEELQWEELSPKRIIYDLIVLIVLISLTTCGAEIINAVMGEKAKLILKYPCDSTKVTLQRSDRHPFYNSNNQRSIKLPSNYLPENVNHTAKNECSLILTINPVSRADQGTYILTAYKNGAMLPDYSRIGLHVDYPPGKALCEISNDYNDGEWVSLQCSAPVGTLPGQIVCYQNDMKLPKGKELTESDRNLNQLILARLDDVVYCCSSVLTGMTDKCDCTDWRWDPMSDRISDIADPCPQAMSTEDPTSTHIFTNSSSSNLVTELTKYPENHKNTSYWTVICTLVTVIPILVIITVSIAYKYHCKANELARLQSSITPESKDPCLRVIEEEVLEHQV